MFKVARTFKNPAQGGNVARGFPAPGSGDQTVGPYTPPPQEGAWASDRPIHGLYTYDEPSDGVFAQGYPAPLSPSQQYPAGSMNNCGVAVPFGTNIQVETPYFSRGAAAYVQNYGKVFTNPIGAGVVALHRPQAFYGGSGNYEAGTIYWVSQAIPTTVNLQGLVDPAALSAVLGDTYVQAAVRVNG
jgi:hypothetical protein